MPFSIDIQAQHHFKRIRICDLTTQVYIDVISKGGLLNSWTQATAKQQWDIIEGNTFENGWNNFEATGFKSGKMNPFSCRLNKGNFTHNNISYKIDKFYLGNHALHGLLYDADFEIISTLIENNHASVKLKYDFLKADKGFPFNYTVELTWIFWEQNKVTVQTKIINQDKVGFPMMDGWHPYFKLGKTIDNCTLQFNHIGLLEYDESLIPTGQILPNSTFKKATKLAGIELDNGYVLDMNHPNCILENEEYQLIVSPDQHYPYLQLYTPPGRTSIAIENLSGAPDCFNNKMGLHIMQPHEVWELSTSYQLMYK